MKAATTPAPRFAIVSEAFFALSPPENALLASYAIGYRDLQKLSESPAKQWTRFFGEAAEGNLAALEKLQQFSTQESFENFENARTRGLWTVFGTWCVENWSDCVTLAERARAAAEKLLAEYRASTCKFRETLELGPRPEPDEVITTLDEVIGSCRAIEAVPEISPQLTEPPRPHFYGLEQIE